MNKKMKKRMLSYVLCAALVVSMIPSDVRAAGKKLKLSSSPLTLKAGQSKALTVKNVNKSIKKKNIKWRVVSGKRYISVKRKGKASWLVRGTKKGTAKLQITVQKKKLVCKVIVKKNKAENNGNKNTTPAPTKVPAVSADTSGGTPVTPKASENPGSGGEPVKTPELTMEPVQPSNTAPENTKEPTKTPAPTKAPGVRLHATNAPAGADEKDVEGIDSLIRDVTEAGAVVPTDLGSDEYTWENGKLTEIDWDSKGLSGNMDMSKLSSLKKLICSDNALSSINVSGNTALKELSCWGNQLENLDVSQNRSLEILYCGDNAITHLDVSSNAALKELSCGGNPLDGLDISANTALKRLSCDRDGLSSLDVSANIQLQDLSCDDNELKLLDVSDNVALRKLSCNGNALESLDVAKNSELETLSCKENLLQSLDLKKNTKLTDLTQDPSVVVTGYDPLDHVADNYEISDNMKWWAYDKFGMFIHFGAYSKYGQGEWAMNEQKISKEKYQTECIAGFNPTEFDAEEIVKSAKAAGMKYIVITAKHHEGFSMWDTQVDSFKDYTGSKFFSLQQFTEFGSTGRDILQELKTACEKEGLKFGLYYSIVDWNHSSQSSGGILSTVMNSTEERESYITDMKAQLKELVDRYDPSVIWFDGDWSRSKSAPTLKKWWTRSDGAALYDYMKSISPDIVVNERVCRGFGLGDFECPEREIPERDSVPGRAWETCQSMNDAWGYKEALEDSYYSSDKLIHDLVTVASEGGNYLLNIGPKGTGEMTDGSRKILSDISEWIRVNGESIYNVSKSPFAKDPSWGTYTRKENTVYAHITEWKDQQKISIEKYDDKEIDRITVLGKSCELNYHIEGDEVILQKPKYISEKSNLVVKIQYK